MSLELLDEPARLQVAPQDVDLLIRPARLSDLEDFLDLAAVAGPGFTSLPYDEAVLADRLIRSETAFAGGSGAMILVLEACESGQVLGCAAVKPGGQRRADFVNFQVSGDRKTLSPTTRYEDLTEVGSLLLHPKWRRNGIGRWLAQSRYLLMATNLARFGRRIFSELRGVVGPGGCSPFFDSVCAPYFDLPFADADQLCAIGRQGELNSLLPNKPIPIDGLSGEAQDVVGLPHRDGEAALRYLIDEGFRYEGVIDLLDGGPAVVANCLDVKTIRCSFTTSVLGADAEPDDGRSAILAAGAGADFRCCRASVTKRGHALVCQQDTLARLNLRHGAEVRACINLPRR